MDGASLGVEVNVLVGALAETMRVLGDLQLPQRGWGRVTGRNVSPLHGGDVHQEGVGDGLLLAVKVDDKGPEGAQLHLGEVRVVLADMGEVGIVDRKLGKDRGRAFVQIGGGGVDVDLLGRELGAGRLRGMGVFAPVLALDSLFGRRRLRCFANRVGLVLEVGLGGAATRGLGRSTLVALRSRHGDD